MRYIFGLAIFFVLFTSAAEAVKIRVGGTGYWSPYCYTSPEDPLTLKGFTVDFLKEVFSQPDDELQFLALPWKRCLVMLENNELDLVLDGSKDSPRLKKFLFSQEIYHLDNALFYLKSRFPDGPQIKSVEDIDKFSLGGVFGFNYKVYPFDVSMVQQGAKDIETMLKMLERRRFELAIGFEQIVCSRMRLKGIGGGDISYILMPNVKSLRFYIFGNHTLKTDKLIERINSALQEMKADGRLAKLKRKYGLQSSKKKILLLKR
ncbi:substrate-binding periplasmic protein [Maridesulfovibrio salexigens]|uniref:Extracellular solute-binding protein family 3 n=1 Tax=Maridesulfovibrio salexigens (strain ATCC 14822 / DSM 2638 / NCIMB 8403 / VKM B-1763) TaxID=526222 RepID=C6BWQ8_MARSD|nr:transporter substrate-binding domain-containing protein [Maridesulfovibrio salexigens]ACS80338.1 extracellular solute-binding protein family 3 [Maridesulfovibrio salexigens DSM 2638]